MSKVDELLPCPFCGGEAKEEYNYRDGHFVECTVCLACSPFEQWNTRYERTCTFEWCVFCEGDSTGEYEAWYCSNCGEVGDELEDVPNHCPYCGAKVVNNE